MAGRRSVASAGGYSSTIASEQVEQRNRANARLIAAAPDLLDSLTELHRQCIERGCFGSVMDNAKAAITKATEE